MPPTDYTIHDPVLSELGRQQCAELKAKLMPRIPSELDVGLIVVSPMKRTIETALLAFGDLIERGVSIVAHAGWQETSLQQCDTGSPLPSLPALYPLVNFTHVDPLFPDKTAHPLAAARYGFSRQAVLARAQTVLRELWDMTELEGKAVLVVSHAGFLRKGVSGCWFVNGDFRVYDMQLVDEEDGVVVGGEERGKWEGDGGYGDGVKGEDDVGMGDSGHGNGSGNGVAVGDGKEGENGVCGGDGAKRMEWQREVEERLKQSWGWDDSGVKGAIRLRQWDGMRKGGLGLSWEEIVPLGEGLPDEKEVNGNEVVANGL